MPGQGQATPTLSGSRRPLEAILEALEAFGFQSSEELAGRLGLSRVRDLERRRLEPLERMGLVERHDGLWGRPKDFPDRDERALAEPYSTVFRRRQRLRTAEGRKVCEVIEIVRDESELERDLARLEQHAGHRREFEERRQKALQESVESDQECRALLNRLDEGREADGFIGELERIEPPKSELDDGLSELAIAVRDYLEQHPQRTAETPSWIATTLWAYELVEGKPSRDDVAAALGEARGGRGSPGGCMTEDHITLEGYPIPCLRHPFSTRLAPPRG